MIKYDKIYLILYKIHIGKHRGILAVYVLVVIQQIIILVTTVSVYYGYYDDFGTLLFFRCSFKK